MLGELCSPLRDCAASEPLRLVPAGRRAGRDHDRAADNRMVGFPYPKLMNAIMEVDQAAAVIMTGSETARELGIPRTAGYTCTAAATPTTNGSSATA